MIVPITKNAKLKNCVLCYHEWGEGPNIIALHGSLATGRQWDVLGNHLYFKYKIIAPDCRGYGCSESPIGDYSAVEMANDLEDLISVLNIDKFHIIGHSMGTRVAIRYASKNLHRVKSIILIDTSGFSAKKRTQKTLDTIRKRPYYFLSKEEAKKYLLDHEGSRWSKEVLEHRIETMMVQLDNGHLRWKMGENTLIKVRERNSDDVLPYASKITCPVLIIRGGDSTTLLREDAEKLNSLFPNSKLVEIEDSTHFILEENPRHLINAITSFLENI
jgi:pimeloyl-ACP methyl ester carboxylesterase